MMKKSIISSALIVHLCMMGASVITIQTACAKAAYAEEASHEPMHKPLQKHLHQPLQQTSKSTIQAIASVQTIASVQDDQQWFTVLMDSFERLPQVQAQVALKRQALLKLSAADNAIYNPQLGLDYQHASDDDTYTIAVSQTIDWSNKREASVRLAQLDAEIILSQVTVERSLLLSQQLLAIVELQQNQKLLVFNQQQFDLARAQLALAEQRVEAGDIAMVELQLMRLEVATNAADLALAEQALINAETQAYTLLGNENIPNIVFASLINTNLNPDVNLDVNSELPALKSAYQQVMLTKLSVNKLKADVVEDPSISLSAEREGRDNKFGIGVSIPLQIRNNYSDSFAAANEDIAIAEQTYLASEKALQQQWRQFNRALPRLLKRYQDWQQLVELSGQEATASISGQWQTGDISTSDYLQSQRQMSSSFIAGVSLEASLYQQWLTWMGESGQLEQVLQQHFSTANSFISAATSLAD